MDHKQYQGVYAEEQVQTKAFDKELIWRLLSYLRPYRIWLMLAIFFLIVSRIIEASVPIFVGKVSQEILDHAQASVGNKNVLFGRIVKECLWILGFLLAGYFLDSINVFLRSWTGQKGLYTLRKQVYEHVINMPLAFYDKNTVGRLMTRTIHDIDQINQMFSESVIPIMGNLFLFVGIFIGILIIDWKIGLFVALLMPIVWRLTQHFRKAQRRCYERIRTIVAAMNTFVQEHLMGASTVRNFGLQGQTRAQFESINEDHCNAYLESTHHFAFFMAGIDLLQSVSLIFAFVLIVLFTPGNQGFQVGIYLTFSLYTLMFFRPLSDLAERYNVLQSALAAAVRIFHLLDTPTEKTKKTSALLLKEVESIVFEDVWFAYEKDHWILKGLSFDVQKGESVALVGMTGEGKSTILSLLLRFYDHQKGNIKINGHDIEDYSLDELRKHFSVVLQDPVLFSGTIADNISLFNSSISPEQIKKVVDYLGMTPLIERFPKGIFHDLHERGKGLSTGEMQLISIARAVANHRSVIALDEATANIDTATEALIQNALKKVLKTSTAFVIAHRLSTIKDIDRILVLKDGKIVEEGSHKALLAAKGIYEKLYRLQFADNQI